MIWILIHKVRHLFIYLFVLLASFSNLLSLLQANEIGNILQACIGLCQRNTPRLNPEESEALWFRLLDSYVLNQFPPSIMSKCPQCMILWLLRDIALFLFCLTQVT